MARDGARRESFALRRKPTTDSRVEFFDECDERGRKNLFFYIFVTFGWLGVLDYLCFFRGFLDFEVVHLQKPFIRACYFVI